MVDHDRRGQWECRSLHLTEPPFLNVGKLRHSREFELKFGVRPLPGRKNVGRTMWRWRISFPVLLAVGLLIRPSTAQDLFQSAPGPEPPTPSRPHRPASPPRAKPNAEPGGSPGGGVTNVGAFAWDWFTQNNYGVSWNQPTSQRADEIALRQCGTSGCKVVQHTGPGECAALAYTQDGRHAYLGTGRDRDAAALNALAGCEKPNSGETQSDRNRARDRAGACILRFTDCNQ
jgi:hypothetical protein